ncbi:cytochrome c oxidase subunit 3 [Arachidicoccus ginsenosidivorans]|uniref:Heme-copper oxidase subunit III n=1 Tax=Arachidicoccus ginsenosidivorans TaxID=496057 RepID=A0A5B8VKE8_9BACT|nr:cytochrome c oxidase subunit 3 [Arachidicoccus ginsenosidivorans]QEC71970.1 heme-copper oxidase subunit III [Arachidicoccus ginsenosidivorans]
MTTVSVLENKGKLHPHKFLLWVGMASIVMMFAGLTSAYVVKRTFSNWMEFGLPSIFWVSTVVILVSSLTMHLALKNFKAHERKKYKNLITVTMILGLLFAALQLYGFTQLHERGIQIFGIGSNASASFLGIIVGLHALHVLGGIIALMIIFFRAYGTKVKRYDKTPIEIVAIYWHFVDILWIYLFLFFSFM